MIGEKQPEKSTTRMEEISNLFQELSSLQRAQLAMRILNPDGRYDGGANGLLAEVWAEVKFDMQKFARGTKGADGMINDKRVSVKSKRFPNHFGPKNKGYISLKDDKLVHFDQMLIVFIDRQMNVRRWIGPFDFNEEIRQVGRLQKNGSKRYFVRDMAKVLGYKINSKDQTFDQI